MTALSNTQMVDLFIGLRPRIERVLAGRVGCPQTAADLVQDMYFRVSRLAGKLPNEDEARRYLLRMATNAATDHFRVTGRRDELLGSLSPLVNEVENGPEHTVINSDQMRVIEAALGELPPKCRDILILSRVEGLTHPEIAARLGISESLVQKYIVRALRHCRVRLNQNTP
ncbi:MAG: sigma-70 family RNA polymerase sigma factor [Gammaproteobacteria bacterium]